MNWRGRIPLLAEEGGCGIQSKLRSHRSAADGVVSSAQSSGLKRLAEPTTPAAPISERIHFIDGASTPPLRGGESVFPAINEIPAVILLRLRATALALCGPPLQCMVIL